MRRRQINWGLDVIGRDVGYQALSEPLANGRGVYVRKGAYKSTFHISQEVGKPPSCLSADGWVTNIQPGSATNRNEVPLHG